MALDDFERQLAEEQAERERKEDRKRKRSKSPGDKRGKHRHDRHHHGSKHHDSEEHRHQRKARRDERDHRDGSRHRRKPRRSSSEGSARGEDHPSGDHGKTIADGSATDILKAREAENEEKPQRMSWMEAPSTEIEHVRSRRPRTPPGYFRKGGETTLLPESTPREDSPAEDEVDDIPAQHEVDYTFGDRGSNWRMKKLQGVYREAKDSGKREEDIAVARFGDLRAFDDAREEEIELNRRERYGESYVGKEKPSGELYQERKLEAGIRRGSTDKHESSSEDEFESAQAVVRNQQPAPTQTVRLDQAALDQLKVDAEQAKSSNAPEAAELQAKYETALATAANSREPDVVVLNKMENRMLAGGRAGEVKTIDNKRGKERGLVEENEDMSIEDMVRQEIRTKGQFGGDSRAFAERIAKDGKFDNDHDYMDDNAAKLAKSVQKSDINLKNMAISDFKKMKRILDKCPLCTHEDTGEPPLAPVVSLATRTYLTLPTSPEITPYGNCASIVPSQHRLNLLECDDDEWEEIRNFMKSLTRFYYSLKPKRSVIFYENAAHEGRKRHASMEAVPLPVAVAENISQYFKESILSADEEWTQHKKVIDTLKKSEQAGFGKNAFRKSMVSELPYFHVWFRLDGGLGHVVEDTRRWPKGDLFAREIIGGVLDVPPEKIKKQGRWRRDDPEMQERVRSFRKAWEQWDWTKALMDAQ